MAEKKKFISVADTPAVRYWDYGRNAGIDPATVASKSGKKFWWICCDCGQPHQKVAQHEQDSQRCRLCGQKYGCRNAMPTRVAKTHSVADDPIGKYWDYERNVGIDPATVAYKSNSVYWWICSKCGKPHQRTATNEQKSTLCQECGREKGSASSYAARVRKTHSIADDPAAADAREDVDDGGRQVLLAEIHAVVFDPDRTAVIVLVAEHSLPSGERVFRAVVLLYI